MSAAIKALFDNTMTSAAEAFGAADIDSKEMHSAVKEWFAAYFARTADEQEDPCQRLPYAIVNKLCKATFAEYDADITNKNKSRKAAWMDKNRAALDAKRKEALQWTLIGGMAWLKPVPYKDAGGGYFTWTVIRRDRCVVLGRAADGSVNSLGTAEVSTMGGKTYTLLEKRTVDARGMLTLENRLFVSLDKDQLGVQVPLGTLPQYEALPASYTFPRPVGGLGLVELKTPMANCVDGSAAGISVYEPAMRLIHNVNVNERQLADEFELGRFRIAASSDTLYTDPKTGEKTLKDKVFVGLDASAQSLGITAFAPALRDESYERRKQSYLKSVENLIGLKRGILSDVEAAERTATEITSSEGDYNLSIIDFQHMWFDAMRAALTLCDTLGQLYKLCDASAFDVATQLAVSWGNGVLYDPDKEWEELLKLVQYQMLKPEIALAWKYDLPWETDKDIAAIREKYMPELAAMMGAV